MNSFIYFIKDEFGFIRYVGQTRVGQVRFKRHISDAKWTKKKQPVLDFIRKSLKLNRPFTFEIAELVSVEALDQREIYWIGFLKDIGVKLLNLTSGGNQGSKRGTPWNKGLVGVCKAWNKGTPSPFKGTPRTNDAKKKISLGHTGKRQTWFYKRVIGQELSTGLELGFPSIGHAAKFVGTLGTNVCKVLKGKKKSYKGWKFSYVETETSLGGVL